MGSQLNGWLFYLEIIMRTTKNWGFTNSGAELYMLAHAERTRKRLAKKKPTGQRLPAKFILKKIWFSIVVYMLIRYNDRCR